MRALFLSRETVLGTRDGFALSLAGMAFPRPKRRTYSEDELYEYAVGALARRMRTVAELKRLMEQLAAESEYFHTPTDANAGRA